MRRIWLACALGATVACAASEPAVLPPMPAAYCADAADVLRDAAAVTSARYPDADWVLLDDRIHVAYAPDGTDVTWDDEWVKVLTEKGRRAAATVSLPVARRYGDVAFETVEIIGTNGVARPVDFRALQKFATDNRSIAANIYDPRDQKLVTAVPGLAVGEIRHVRFCRRTRKARMKGAWAERHLLEMTFPVRRTVITVDQPPEAPVRHAVVRHAHGATLRRRPDRPLPGGHTLLAWEARDVPQAFPEPSMPPWEDEVQTLHLSTVADWSTVSRWYWQLVAPHLDAASPALTNAVAACLSGATDDNAKIRALFRFVSQQIRYLGLTAEDEAPGYEPHDVALTFANRYGVCRDKAALLVAMLRIAGFTARPALVRVGGRMDREVPSIAFNHAIVAVRQAGGWLFMDPTDEAARDLLPAYLSDCPCLVADPNGETLAALPVRDVRENRLTVDSEGAVTPSGAAVVTSRVRCGGINDTALRHAFVRRTEEGRRQLVEAWLKGVAPSAELLTLTVTPADLAETGTPLAFTFQACYPGVRLRGATCDELAPPLLTRVLSVVQAMLDENTALETRRFPLVFDSTAGTEEHLALRLAPETGPLQHLPSEVHVGAGTPYGFTAAYGVTNGVLHVTQSQQLASLRFEPSAYAHLRDDRKLVEALTRARPRFVTNPAAEADIRTLDVRREIVFRAPDCWVATNSVVREVLTYQGKKAASELTFDYNPACEQVDVIAATVSNRNGRVLHATARERHVLDCAWAAAAPRYPAGRKLVINLPGVETGSVISYTVVHSVSNAPGAFTAFTCFDSVDPREKTTVKMAFPATLPLAWRTTGFDRPGARELSDVRDGCRRLAWQVVAPPRLPREPALPPASFWRTTLFATTAQWPDYCARLNTALRAARAAGADDAAAAAHAATVGCDSSDARLAAIRRAVCRRVRVVGPGLLEVPFEQAFFPPDRVWRDGYGSFADRQNLLFAQLEAVGFACRFVLCADDAQGLAEITQRYQKDLPRPDFFDTLVVRAEQNGRVFYLAGENEYTPPACSAREGDTYLDLATGAWGTVCPETSTTAAWWAPWTWGTLPRGVAPGTSVWSPRVECFRRLVVEADGGVAWTITNWIYGAGAGAFRKRYAELLPEMRNRLFQSLLGDLAEGASATGPLVTDTTGYPAVRAFSAYVPAYAVVADDTLTLTLPSPGDELVALGLPPRRAPIDVPGATAEMVTYEIVLPPGYAQVEYVPAAYELKDPVTGEIWQSCHVATRRAGSRLIVTLVWEERARKEKVFSPDFAPYFRAWNERLTSRTARTLIFRR